MAAFVRMGHQPIHERGLIQRADLVVVADDTLLGDPSAAPLAGCGTSCVVLVNSTKDTSELRHEYQMVAEHVYVADFTTIAVEHAKTLASLSTALGVASARLVGLPWADVEIGMRQELADHVPPDQWNSNVALARAAYAVADQWQPIPERNGETVDPAVTVIDVGFDPPRVAAPSISAQANSPERKTGTWRQVRPVLHPERCTRCWICFVRCPEAAISLDAQDYPVVNYDECKGCLLCVHECPTHAFSAEKEVR
jgi:pyruvate ferredoxin oxidoreductase gamma subunit